MARNHFLYFGREMAFTDKNGEEHPNSFWKLDDFRISTSRREMLLVFVGWHSKEVFDAGDESLSGVGGRREYAFTGEDYDRLIIKYAAAVAGVALAGWEITGLVKDTPTDTDDFESFFASAGGVLVPEE